MRAVQLVVAGRMREPAIEAVNTRVENSGQISIVTALVRLADSTMTGRKLETYSRNDNELLV